MADVKKRLNFWPKNEQYIGYKTSYNNNKKKIVRWNIAIKLQLNFQVDTCDSLRVASTVDARFEKRSFKKNGFRHSGLDGGNVFVHYSTIWVMF